MYNDKYKYTGQRLSLDGSFRLHFAWLPCTDDFQSNKKKFAKLVTFTSQLTVLLDAHIEDINSLIRVYPTHVGPHVRRMFGSIRTIGTVESRQLTALELEVIIQIVLACKYVAALVARITLVLSACVVGIINALG